VTTTKRENETGARNERTIGFRTCTALVIAT
jgi:hypothetical protein